MSIVSFIRAKGAVPSLHSSGNLALDLSCVSQSMRVDILTIAKKHKTEIMIELLKGASAPSPWTWLPERCPAGECWDAWDCSRMLRDVCLREDFSLYRWDGRFILVPWTPLTPDSASMMDGCIEYLLVEAFEYLERHAEHFPVLTSAEARKCLSRQDCYRRRKDGVLLCLYGLSFPNAWPVAARIALQTIYVASVTG